MDIYLQCNIIYYNNPRGAFKSLSNISLDECDGFTIAQKKERHEKEHKINECSASRRALRAEQTKVNTISDADCWLHYCLFSATKKNANTTKSFNIN